MKRVEIAPRAATAALWLMMLFAAGAMLIGALMVGGAGNIARAQGGSVISYIIAGAFFGVLGAVALAYGRRQLGAVREIEIDAKGWTLVDRRGRTTTLAPGTTVELVLRCRREIYTWGGIPRIRDVVDGVARAGGTDHRLAPSGPVTYSQVLPQLGISAAAPARGTTARHRLTV